MSPNSMKDPITRISDYAVEVTPIDIEALMRTGRRRRIAQHGALAGGITVLAAATVGAIMAVQSGSGQHGKAVIQSASAPRSDHGLLAAHPADGQITTLVTAPSGWKADAYVDNAGELCEGWVDPASLVMQGACGVTLAASGPTNGTAALDTPVQIEPEAAVSDRLVYAFGIVGPQTRSVTVTDRGKPLTVVYPGGQPATAPHAFLVRYPMPRIADWVDTATAYDANGNQLASMTFVAPDTGQPAGPQPKPTMSATTTLGDGDAGKLSGDPPKLDTRRHHQLPHADR